LQAALTDLQHLQREFREDLGERVLAFLDDVTILRPLSVCCFLSVASISFILTRPTGLQPMLAGRKKARGDGLTPDR